MSDKKIVFLTDLIEQKLRKEKEIEYYETKLKEITDKLFFLKKEQDLTNLIINIIQHEKITDIKDRVDIVDVFRPSNEVLEIAKDTVNINAKVLWLQLGIKNEEAKKLVQSKNIEYIENKCTKMEYQKYFLKMRQAFPVLQD